MLKALAIKREKLVQLETTGTKTKVLTSASGRNDCGARVHSSRGDAGLAVTPCTRGATHATPTCTPASPAWHNADTDARNIKIGCRAAEKAANP